MAIPCRVLWRTADPHATELVYLEQPSSTMFPDGHSASRACPLAVCSLGPHSAVTQGRPPAWSSALLFAFVSFTPTWWISPLAQHLGPLLLPHSPYWHWPEWIRRSGVVETVSSCGNPGKMTCEYQVQKRGNILASGELEANGLIQCPLPCQPSPEEQWAICPGAGCAPVCDSVQGQVPGAGDRKP